MNSITGLNESLIIFGGLYHLGFGVFHLFFWRILNWKTELALLSDINRPVMQILNLCLTFVFFFFAYISLFYSSELLQTELGKVILFFISLFWFIRMIEQILFFGIRIPPTFILTFLLGSIIYAYPLLNSHS